MNRAAAALSWDGAQVSPTRLTAKARAFLGPLTSAKKMAALLAVASPIELRICWVPRLRGGSNVLQPPFDTFDGKRVAFRTIRTVAFGEILGVVYRR